MKFTKFDPLPQSEIPAPCPWCGHRPRPYAQKASNLRHLRAAILLLEAMVADLKAGLEEAAS